jgi:hypothetical protein
MTLGVSIEDEVADRPGLLHPRAFRRR